jgi:DNA-binding LytR/AlgR family response regulator
LTPENILLIQATDGYAQVLTKTYCKSILVPCTLTKICLKLRNHNNLIKCHKSFVVNISHVSSFCSKKKVIRIGGYVIPISRRKAMSVYKVLLDNEIPDQLDSTVHEIFQPIKK